METTDLLLLFFTMVTLSALPGPSDLALVLCTLQKGVRQAMWMTAGIVAGDAVLLLVAVQGWNWAAHLPTVWLAGLQIMGGLVLVWLGGRVGKSSTENAATTPAPTSRLSFAGGLLITLGEPEALLFYFALLPAFVEPAYLNWKSGLVVMGLATGAIFLVKTGYIVLAHQVSRLLQTPRTQLVASRLSSGVLLALGAYLIGSNLLRMFH